MSESLMDFLCTTGLSDESAPAPAPASGGMDRQSAIDELLSFDNLVSCDLQMGG